MSQPAPATSLSLSARLLFYLGPPSAIILTGFVSPQTAVISPVAFLPTVWFFRRWREAWSADPSRRGELEPMAWTLATSSTLGLTCVGLVQAALCKASSLILFKSDAMRKDFWIEFGRSSIDGLTAEQLTHRARLASSWQNWTFNLAFAFVAAGLAEETLKYIPIAYARRRGTPEERKLRNRSYFDYAIAGALGFSIVETIGFIYGAVKNNERGVKLALTVIERLGGQVAHLSVAWLTAARATRRDYYGDQLSWWSVIGPAALYHGAFDFTALSFSAMEGNVGWVHPSNVGNVITMLGGAISITGAAVWQATKEWQALDERDKGNLLSGTNKAAK